MLSESKVMIVLRKSDWCQWNAQIWDSRSTGELDYAGGLEYASGLEYAGGLEYVCRSLDFAGFSPSSHSQHMLHQKHEFRMRNIFLPVRLRTSDRQATVVDSSSHFLGRWGAQNKQILPKLGHSPQRSLTLVRFGTLDLRLQSLSLKRQLARTIYPFFATTGRQLPTWL